MKLITSITSNNVGVITSNHVGDFYFLNCLHSYRTKDKLKEYENVCKNHDYCYIETSNENNKISKYNHGEKSMKAPFIIYSDLEPLLEKKMSTCHNNPKESASGYSLFTNCSFDGAKNKLDYYRRQDCTKKFCKDLKEHAAKKINFEKKT